MLTKLIHTIKARIRRAIAAAAIDLEDAQRGGGF
jgi:hypothetical protein